MKIRTTLFITILIAILTFLTSCHTETPVNIDNINPEIKLLTVFNDTDTLFSSETGNFTDFSDTLFTEAFNFTISLSDNNGLYKVCLSAEDYFTGEDWEIKTIKNIQNGELTVSSIYKDYPVVQDSPFQKFYLKITASDESENSITSTKLGFYITKPYPFNLFYESLVLIKEVDGDSVDFREKHGKLGFVQFISKGCLSCVDEAKAMKEMYLDTTYYDLDLYSHSLIGNYTFTEAEFKSFKTRDYKLPYDCFYDNPGNIKHFFETLLGKQIENEVFAVLPDGKIFEYNYLEGNFTDWIRSMYCRAYPN